jgi:hypothetical protein
VPVPPNFQRFLPFILIAFVLLFVLPTLLKKKSTAPGPSPKTRAAQTIDAVDLIDQAEQGFQAAHGRYSAHLSDLVALRPRLAADLVIGLTVQLDAGTDGQSYVAQVASDVLSLVRSRTGSKVTARSCLVVKSGSGVACPA